MRGPLKSLMTISLRQFFVLLPAKLREEDKIQHMVWSFWMTLAALIVLTGPLAFLLVFLLGLAKECWDFRYGNGFCVFDMAGNLLGSLAGLLCGLALSALLAG